MVYFIDSVPKKRQYRKYKIKTVKGIDDFESISEIIARRYKRVLNENLPLPDLIVIDGGKGQLNSASRSLNKLGLDYIPIIGLAKKMEEVYRPGIYDPQNISKTSPGLLLLRHIRDEAHRFAITFHRQLRDNKMTHSILKEIPGLGSIRIQAIWSNFSSLEELKNTSIEEISNKTNIPISIIIRILNHINK